MYNLYSLYSRFNESKQKNKPLYDSCSEDFVWILIRTATIEILIGNNLDNMIQHGTRVYLN